MDIRIRKLSNLILYSSLWIAACAAAQVQLTYDITGIVRGLDTYTAFVLSSTLVLYSIHRLVGIRRVQAFAHIGRYAVIRKYRPHIITYGLIAGIASIYFLLKLPYKTCLYLLLPVIISAAYVVPIRPGKMRLRDIPFIKIFLIAASWSLITTTVPLLHVGYTGPHLVTIFMERFLFIIAITIPFDIRDLTVDQHSHVKTIPHVLGVNRSKRLSIILLLLSASFVVYLVASNVYAHDLLWPYALVLVLTGWLIIKSEPDLDDHYYSGLLDGTMFLLPFLYWLLCI